MKYPVEPRGTFQQSLVNLPRMIGRGNNQDTLITLKAVHKSHDLRPVKAQHRNGAAPSAPPNLLNQAPDAASITRLSERLAERPIAPVLPGICGYRID